MPRNTQRTTASSFAKYKAAAVQSLKKGKSTGVDNIPVELVQAGEEDVITALMTVCNRGRRYRGRHYMAFHALQGEALQELQRQALHRQQALQGQALQG